jgi:hypothetical protein
MVKLIVQKEKKKIRINIKTHNNITNNNNNNKKNRKENTT